MARSVLRHCEDLIAAIVIAIAICGAVLWPPVQDSFPVVLFALLLVVFLPGYTLLAALFPEDGAGPVDSGADGTDFGIGYYPESGIDITERAVFSVVLSIVTVPLLGLVIDATSYGLRRAPVAVTLTAMTVVAAVVGIIRRASTPPEERFSLWPYFGALRRRVANAPSASIAMNSLIVVCLLIAVSGGLYAAAEADEGETLTELYLLSESDEGELVNEVPEQFVSGTGTSIHVGVGNLEHESVTYSVIIRVERVDQQSGEVVESEELDSYEVTLEHGDESVTEREIRPPFEGEQLRLAVLLYVDDPPAEPTAENAYRDVYAWIDVVSP